MGNSQCNDMLRYVLKHDIVRAIGAKNRCDLLSVSKKEPGCEVIYTNQTIIDGNCRSTTSVSIGEQCSGTCQSSVSVVNGENQANCLCCQVVQTTDVAVEMECGDPSRGYLPTESKTIRSITECWCLDCDVEDVV